MVNSSAECDLYGGLAGLTVDDVSIDFGHGIGMRTTYAHVMENYAIAFRKPDPPRHYGEPWKPVLGGSSVDLCAELHVPSSYIPPHPLDRLNTIWWITALARLRSSPYLYCPVVANTSFSQARDIDNRALRVWPMETAQRKEMDGIPDSQLTRSDLEWVSAHWEEARLMRKQSTEFALATLAFDQCVTISQPALAMLSLWGALEALFSPAPSELRFRVSANLAVFLEPPGDQRMELQTRISKLYDIRSKAAHGRSADITVGLTETYNLLKRALITIIEERRVPSDSDLRGLLFGGRSRQESAAL